MKKILIISIFFYPEPIGISKYTAEMAEWLSTRGYDVKVITAKPFYPQWHIYPEYRRKCWWYNYESFGNLNILRCPLWVPKKVTGMKRLVHLSTFGFSSTLAILSQLFTPPDYIFVILPTFVNLPAAILISKILRKPSWLHIQDFELDLAENLSILGNIKKPYEWLKLVEQLLFRSFNKVSTISNGMLQRLIHEKQVPSPKVTLFPNWVDCNVIKPMEKSSYREKLSISRDSIIVLYSGNMGRKYDLEMLASTAKHLVDNPKISFIFCGDGVARNDLEVASKGLKNVIFMPLQPEEQLNDLLNLADIHLLPQKEDAANSVMPSKLLGIMASGKPVIATVANASEIGQVVKDCGLVVPPGDRVAFTKAILLLANDATLRHNLGEKGRTIAMQRFDKSVVLAQLQEHFTNL